ncbi:DapH/DapD/GlmU-related protein [Acidovorax sp. SUPP3334]|uniref:DapH/DapD/GlmU-related protein n=1 Tax=Acidovorax sp. SUPP3334 TaxID=2920881 RepID=UPI0023DE428E|nr:DapH/DapD/GlmU-related protein [Acidovorax sp. SUPP3334]GKT24224.1 UDP-3-O-(3-hydroxymyristoyl)glucosamine N-acyltransferase [Acidovorax sp. SUPP3334]
MPSKFVIGSAALLKAALASWSEIAPNETLYPIDVGQDRDYRFDLTVISNASPSDATAFVIWGSQFLNFRRLELMGELKSRGFRMPPLICRGALIAPTSTIGENCVIGAGTIIGAGCRVGFNSVIGAGCVLGAEAQIASSTWIGDGVMIGMQSRVGANATLGAGVILSDGVSIGKQSILDLPGRHSESLPEKTFILSTFPSAVSITDSGRP